MRRRITHGKDATLSNTTQNKDVNSRQRLNDLKHTTNLLYPLRKYRRIIRPFLSHSTPPPIFGVVSPSRQSHQLDKETVISRLPTPSINGSLNKLDRIPVRITERSYGKNYSKKNYSGGSNLIYIK